MPVDTPAKIRELVETHILVSAKDRLDIDQITEHFTSITGVSPPAITSELESRKFKKKKDKEQGHSRGSSNSSTKSNEKTRM